MSNIRYYDYTKESVTERFGNFIMDYPVVFAGLIMGFIILLVSIVSCMFISTGEKQYTGYIYSAEDGIARTVGHLRFSENAGMDTQPSFCVDKKDGQQIKELAVSGKKVKVTIPAGFAFAFPWTCPIPASIEIMEERNE